MNLHGKDVYALITGSSRGFGQSIADAFLSSVLTHAPRSVTLTLRGTPTSRARIVDLRSQLLQKHQGRSPILKLDTILQDFQHLTASEAGHAISTTEAPTYAYLFNNSGILIPSSLRVMDMSDLQKTICVNVIAMCQISQAFINTFKSPTILHIIHTSSLAALKPFASWGAYCISKAAADMMHRVLAHEHANQQPKIRVLQYAPGPLRTDMVDLAAASDNCDPSLAADFIKMRTEDTPISPQASAAKLMGLLLDDNFNNDDHIDFYEI